MSTPRHSCRYRCTDCGWIGEEFEMQADSIAPADASGEELWSNWICPGCGMWNWLDDYEIEIDGKWVGVTE